MERLKKIWGSEPFLDKTSSSTGPRVGTGAGEGPDRKSEQ